MILINIIIFLSIFIIILWLQYNDDIKFKNYKNRIALYDKIKIPLFVATIVILLTNINYNECFNEIQSIFVLPCPNVNYKNNNINLFDDVFTEQPDF